MLLTKEDAPKGMSYKPQCISRNIGGDDVARTHDPLIANMPIRALTIKDEPNHLVMATVG